MKKLKIPYIKSRGLECGQTCAVMMVNYFKPKFNPNIDEVNSIIHHKPGKYTFPIQHALLLDSYGIKTRCYSSHPLETTSENPNLFKKWFGEDLKNQLPFLDEETYNWSILEARKRNVFEQKVSKFAEIINYFKHNYLVCFVIDWNTLMHKKSSYQGHFVILSGLDEKNRIGYIHDPDNGPYQKYQIKDLEKAYLHTAIANDLFVAFGLKQH